MSIAEQLQQINNKIIEAAKTSGRKFEEIKIVAVSKKISAEKIREAYALGHRSFAENYVQEAIAKKASLSDLDIDWHFIGHLQSNKIKNISDQFNLIHSVDRLKIANEIALRTLGTQKILIEVNLAAEASKSGCDPSCLPELIENVQKLDHINLSGLMFMPPLDLSENQQRTYYQKARELTEKLQKSVSSPHSLLELSMGTSHDFQVAIEEGATLIRLGTVLFGQRQL